MTTRLSRRTMLRGLGSAALALPALEIMGTRAWAAGAPPSRFVVSFAGASICGDVGSAADLASGRRVDQGLVVPTQAGAGYALTRGLQPLGDLGVKGDVSVISGLDIPVAANDTDPIPVAGASPHFHGQSRIPQLCGVSTGAGYTGWGKAPTADQLVADAIAGSTPQRVLAYRVQAATYVTNSSGGGNGSAGTSSYRLDPATQRMQAVTAVYSPHQAFASLFGSFSPPNGSAEDASKAALLLARRKSVVDLVRDDTQRLMGRLGRADQQRMQRHLDEIRGMETRLQAVELPVGSACASPGDHTDPPISGASYLYDPGQGSTVLDLTTNGYSDEDTRADWLIDYIAMAFACDLSRVANFWLTYHQSFMSMFKISGAQNHMHGLSHSGNQGGAADATAWHVKQFGKLVKKLKETPEVDGKTLLDHTSLAMVFEGGCGAMTDIGGNKPGKYSHSMQQMMVLVAGRAGGLQPGKHVLGAGRHPGQAVFSAMKAAGYGGAKFGELTSGLPELFS